MINLNINGVNIEYNGNVNIIKKAKYPRKTFKYPVKTWCVLIAFLINSDMMAMSVEPHQPFTYDDIYNSNPTGELAFLLHSIESLESALKNTPENDFTKLCFRVLDGENIEASPKYASLCGIKLYRNIFPLSNDEMQGIDELLKQREIK